VIFKETLGVALKTATCLRAVHALNARLIAGQVISDHTCPRSARATDPPACNACMGIALPRPAGHVVLLRGDLVRIGVGLQPHRTRAARKRPGSEDQTNKYYCYLLASNKFWI
jgi:hypothetical protein